MSGDHCEHDDEVLRHLGNIKKPELRVIELRSQKDGGYGHYVKLFRFVAAHASTLEMLNMQVNLVPSETQEDPKPDVRKLKMELSKMNIRQLKIKLPAQEGHAPYKIGEFFGVKLQFDVKT